MSNFNETLSKWKRLNTTARQLSYYNNNFVKLKNLRYTSALTCTHAGSYVAMLIASMCPRTHIHTHCRTHSMRFCWFERNVNLKWFSGVTRINLLHKHMWEYGRGQESVCVYITICLLYLFCVFVRFSCERDWDWENKFLSRGQTLCWVRSNGF